MVNKKPYLIKLKSQKTTKTKIKDIYSKERIVKLPKADTYDLYGGVEESNPNHLLLQGQVIGDYFAMIKLDITFKEKNAKVILKTYAENFLKKYNGEFNFKLK